MKNLILFMPSIEIGGVEKNLFLIANYLEKKGITVKLITSNKKYIKKLNKNIEVISSNNNFFLKKKKYIKYFFCLFLLFLEYCKNRQIIVFSFQANIYAVLLCKLLRIKIITRSNTSPSGWSKNVIKKKIFKFIINYADLIIVNSLEFKRQMKSIFKVNTQLIYNPLNKNEIQQSKKVNLKNSRLKIINVARFTEQKDHLTLLKAFKLLIKKNNNAFLIIIGRGYEENNIKNFIYKNKLNKNVKLITNIQNPYGHIKWADIFVLTSKYEGLPNVLLEALCLKKYIISTDCPTGPKEILNKGKYGDLVKVGDYKKIYNLLNNYKKNKYKIKKKIKNGFLNLHKYDYKSNCEQYYNSIKKFL
jgi:glycosyltransferase involved in cell wall biosynthesis